MTLARLYLPDRKILALALAKQVADDLSETLEGQGHASLVVPGGTTPGAFLAALGEAALDWSRVTVTLSDERWVPPGHECSNERALRDSLMVGIASAARFVPLYREGLSPEAALSAIEADLRPALPLSVCVLGMGADGHTASLFADADGLDAALDSEGDALALPIRRADLPEPRLTLTVGALTGAAHSYLLITGEDKRAALDAALASEAAEAPPIRTILERLNGVRIYWAP